MTGSGQTAMREVAFMFGREAIFILDDGNRIVACNPSGESALDCVPGECIGNELVTYLVADSGALGVAIEHARAQQARWPATLRDEVWIRTTIGRSFPAELRIVNIETCNGWSIAVMLLDLTAVKFAEKVVRDWDSNVHTALRHTIEALGKTVAQRDPYTAFHQVRVSELASAIGAKLGMNHMDIQGLEMGGLLHDIGKIHIPGEILTRPGRFSPEEYSLVQTHVTVGHDILAGIELPWPVADIAGQHHERLDGSGYPDGLEGDAIHPLARITAVADVMESMTAHRPYRPGHGKEIALAELTEQQGDQYDADAVDACRALFNDDGFDWQTDITASWTASPLTSTVAHPSAMTGQALSPPPQRQIAMSKAVGQ